jgi:lipopolysaccharide export LptBFGC system permease protein LptF
MFLAYEDRSKMTSDEYKKAFRLPADSKAQNGDVLDSATAPKANCESALAIALDIRKFEIELYWKRATYFWSFLAVTLAGYFGLLVAKDLPSTRQGEALLTVSCVSCLGVVFSVAWYFVNRASKFWQENWEKHVDLLEDARELGRSTRRS